ncbi:hypothetical protein DL768_008070 [Monosporascus sp. mg162]|nr:hypothetical protein DL768_008070 [Monosporascus sp. mg162]
MAAESSPQEDPIVKALLEFTTCDVSDALCKLGQPHGGFLPGLTMWSPQRQDGPTKIVGPAYTVKYVPLDNPAPKHPTHYVGEPLPSPFPFPLSLTAVRSGM